MNQTIFNLTSRQNRCLDLRIINLRIIGFLFFVVTMALSSVSSAALLVTPSRVVFENNSRAEQITLTNKGEETTTYRISFIRQNMTETGKFQLVEEGEEGLFSDKMVRYSPRQITLKSGQSQVVRLLLRKPRDLVDGEYRSHMLMQALPEVTKSDISKAVDDDSDEIKIEITTIIGISIPVIVRSGKLDAELKLSNASFVKASVPKKNSFINVDMTRDGKASVYGDFRVTYTDENGSSTIVANVKGVAVYSPNTLRHFQIPINHPTDIKFDKGHFHIAFSEYGKDEQSGLIASFDLKL